MARRNALPGLKSGRITEPLLLTVVFILTVAAAFWYRGSSDQAQDLVTIRNISTLLFGILAGFFVAFLLNRFAAIRSLLTRETTMLMEIYKLSESFGPEFAQRTADRIDRYLIVRFDEDNYFRFTVLSRDAFFTIFDELDTVDLKNSQNLITMHRHFVSTMRDAISLRRETIVSGAITVSRLQWCPLLLLAAILIFTMFAMKSDTFTSSFLTGSLSFSILLILYVIKDMSDLKLGGDFLKYETVERVFNFIGKERYYTIGHLEKGLIPECVDHVRLGIGKDAHYSKEIISVSSEDAYQRAKNFHFN